MEQPPFRKVPERSSCFHGPDASSAGHVRRGWGLLWGGLRVGRQQLQLLSLPAACFVSLSLNTQKKHSGAKKNPEARA